MLGATVAPAGTASFDAADREDDERAERAGLGFGATGRPLLAADGDCAGDLPGAGGALFGRARSLTRGFELDLPGLLAAGLADFVFADTLAAGFGLDRGFAFAARAGDLGAGLTGPFLAPGLALFLGVGLTLGAGFLLGAGLAFGAGFGRALLPARAAGFLAGLFELLAVAFGLLFDFCATPSPPHRIGWMSLDSCARASDRG